MSFLHLSVEELGELTTHPDTLIVDIRDTWSYQQGHIDGAINLTDSTMGSLFKEKRRDQAIIVCCYHGYNSQYVANLLTSFGFSQVYSLDGGFEAWENYQRKPQ